MTLVCGLFPDVIALTVFVFIGITWTLLHEMDFQKYISVRHDYILLPEDALTNTTRLRWWQPFVISNGIVVAGVERAQWALDNILIGGAEINPSQLVDTFDDGKKNAPPSILCASCLCRCRMGPEGAWEHRQGLVHAAQPAIALGGPCSL